MKRAEKNQVKLQQSIKNIWPAAPLANPYPQSPVTLEMLLEHTTGLTELSGKKFNAPTSLSLQQAFQVRADTRPVKWQPGYYKSYSNAGAGYVAAAIEHISKRDYDTWFIKLSCIKWV
jgi:CubicO group peptidase (beta-lactamase class C family)